MKHVTEFDKINEYIDILNTDIKRQIINILNDWNEDICDGDIRAHFDIRAEYFDELSEEISKLFK